jgi:uncharacterized protein (DUF2062 family)
MMKLKEYFHKLLQVNRRPEEIALGVAIGIFIGILPFYGFHTGVVLVLAMFIPGVNKIAALLGSNISIPPIGPLIDWLGYHIGRGILNKGHPVLEVSAFHRYNYKNIGELVYPLVLGCIVLGIIGAAIAYFATLFFLKRKRL